MFAFPHAGSSPTYTCRHHTHKIKRTAAAEKLENSFMFHHQFIIMGFFPSQRCKFTRTKLFKFAGKKMWMRHRKIEPKLYEDAVSKPAIAINFFSLPSA